ncbi:MAG: radical SAM protein [Desulfurococcus sp.]
MRFFTSFFYGIHPSKCYGYIVNIDPLLPPGKCALNCPYCPLPIREVVGKGYSVRVNIEHFKSILEKHGDVLAEVKRVRIWGFGDPFLVENLGELLMVLREYMRSRGVDGSLILHSSGLTLHRTVKMNTAELIDEVGVAFPWCIGERPLHGFGGLINVLQSFPEKDRLVIEVLAYRRNSEIYPDPLLLQELSSCIKKTGVNRIRVKTLSRPSFNEELKPVSRRVLNDIVRHLEEDGFDVSTCNMNLPPLGSIKISGLLEVIYNHILRLPLSTRDILQVYGENGLIAVKNIVDEQKAVTRVWENTLFYRGIP